MDERDDDLFGEDPLDDLEQDSPDLFEQDGPDLFAAAGIPDVQDLPEEAADPLTRSVGEQDAVDASLMEAVDARRLPERQITDRPETPLALYRRYRPETFAEVIGQEHVTEPLQRALENNRVNHAYLFSGPRGCGKTTSARILARCLNCEQGPTPNPCGVCQSCRDLARGGTGSIDVIEIDAASHGGVNEARDLRERAFFAPVHSRYKIYIIDEAHMVTKEGFNALLKVVEEPPPHVKFIFATTEPEKVLGTIRSRTHHYPFRLVPPKTLSAYLATLCDAEGIAVEPAVLPLVVRAGAGSVRDSLSVLDQLLGGAGPDGVSYGQATSLLGYTPDSLLDEIVDAFAAGDARGVFAAVDKVIEVGQDPRRFAEDLLRRLRDLIIVAAVPEALSSGLIDVAGDQADRLTSQANALGAGELTRAAEVIAVGLTEMRGTTAPRLHLELMCARVLLPGADADGRGIHARLDRLERRLDVTTPDGEQPPVAPSRPARGAAAPQPDAPVSAPPVEDAAAPHDPWAATPSSTPARKEPAPTPQNRTPAAAPPASPDPAAPSASVAAESDRQVVATPPAATPPATTPEAAPAPPAPPAPVSHRSATSGSATPLATADVRRLWPEILDNIKNRRRFTWILLSQNAQVVDVRDGVLTIGLANAGARDSFSHGGSLEVLRDAIVDILGTSLRIEPIIDATADDPAATASAPAAATTPAAEAAAPSSTSRSAAAEAARANIRPTRSAPSANTPEPDEPEPDPDDPVVAEDAASSEELLMKHLGAELIENPDL